ncbi:hypothetical protein [Caldalkalibacillus mannanilyticus]|uniref:hypothetical protein n=1 Tax=Caldalkalibacillus mannanilyticus TaxID=1418 RepID=UPI000468E1EB|nr:hypothetical protein [Caldalkalibacillus mannanilyticus]
MKKIQATCIILIILGIIVLEYTKPDLEQRAISVVEEMIEAYSIVDKDRLELTVTEEMFTVLEKDLPNDPTTETRLIFTITDIHITEITDNTAKVESVIEVSATDWTETEQINVIFTLVRWKNTWKIAAIDS